MKKLFLFILFGNNLFLQAMDFDINDVQYRRAVADDAEALLQLVNEHAIHDSDKIVIVPKNFRESTLESAVSKERLFVAQYNKHLIGYKKLFLVHDASERREIIEDECRCTGFPADAAYVDDAGQIITSISDKTDLISHDYTYIYNGADFTQKPFRNRGINKALTDAALFSIKNELKDLSIKTVVMLYGLTKANAGNLLIDGRTRSILKSFTSFVRSLPTNTSESCPIMVARHHAFMPTFDPKSEKCIPLPDDKSIPGYGYAMTCVLKK